MKLKEIVTFQAREHALFIKSQIAFYIGFLDTIGDVLPRFNLNEAKL